jgi:ParB family chromosome partitioning protein
MPPPKRPTGSRPRPDQKAPAQTAVLPPLPSSQHSDGDAIIQRVLSAPARPAEQPVAPQAADRLAEHATWALLEHLAHRPDNPRWAGEYDPAQDPELAAFVESVTTYGVLQPVTVTSVTAWLEHHPEHADSFDEGVQWVVVMGNRRLAGAVFADLAGLPIHRNDKLAGRRASREAPIIENYQRKPFDAVREGAEMAAILQDGSLSRRELARRLGMSHTQVNQRLQLLELIDEFRGMVSDQTLTVEKALPVARLDHDQQRRLLELGTPYTPGRLDADRDVDVPDDELHTVKPVTIRRHSGPEQVVDALRAGLPPAVLAEVRKLLVEA